MNNQEKEKKELLKYYYLEKHYGQDKCSKLLGPGIGRTTIKKWLKEMNLPIRNFDEAKRTCRLYNYNKDINYFNNQSNNMAWLLGFLASDGTVSLKRNTIKIGLSSKDKEILEKIKDELKIENKITEYTTNTGFDVVELSWTCKEHKDILKNYGIIPQKTNYLEPPILLDEKYWIDYLRGYFDGDGSICKINGYLRFSIVSNTKEILNWFVNWLYEKYNIPKVNI